MKLLRILVDLPLDYGPSIFFLIVSKCALAQYVTEVLKSLNKPKGVAPTDNHKKEYYL